MGALDYLHLGKKRPLRVAAYCRISFDEEKDGSDDNQRSFLHKAIMDHPEWKLVGVYGDYARTGTMIKGRTEFQKMMRSAEAGNIDYIISKSISRFSRNANDTLKSLRKLKKLGVGVYFMEQGLDSLDNMGEMVLTTLATIAQMESESIGGNTKMNFDAMNERGIPLRKCSYGYERQGYEWVIDSRKAIRVKLAFLMAANGFRLAAIARHLNLFEQKDRTGRVWTGKLVRLMLESETYTGDVLTNKSMIVWEGFDRKTKKNDGQVTQYYIKNHHDPMVGRTIFETVSAMAERGELAGQKNYKGIGGLQELAKKDHLLDEVRKYLPKGEPAPVPLLIPTSTIPLPSQA